MKAGGGIGDEYNVESIDGQNQVPLPAFGYRPLPELPLAIKVLAPEGKLVDGGFVYPTDTKRFPVMI